MAVDFTDQNNQAHCEEELDDRIIYERGEYLQSAGAAGDGEYEEIVATEFEDYENMEMVARNTIMRMRESNLLVQFPQDEFLAPVQTQRPVNFSNMIVKRPLILEECESEESKNSEMMRARGQTIKEKSQS